MEGIYKALGGPWLIAAEIEAIPTPVLTDYVWDEHARKVSHLVVSDRNLHLVGDVDTVCGAVTTSLQTFPEYGICAVCLDKTVVDA